MENSGAPGHAKEARLRSKCYLVSQGKQSGLDYLEERGKVHAGSIEARLCTRPIKSKGDTRTLLRLEGIYSTIALIASYQLLFN